MSDVDVPKGLNSNFEYRRVSAAFGRSGGGVGPNFAKNRNSTKVLHRNRARIGFVLEMTWGWTLIDQKIALSSLGEVTFTQKRTK